MLSIVLLGTGNVAHHLFDAFSDKDAILVKQVFGRNPDSLVAFSNKSEVVLTPKAILEADIYIIAVSDDAIVEVSNLLENKKGLVVHTSGSILKDSIKAKRKGVFYPLQTFTNGKKVDFAGIPICIEADTDSDVKLLRKLAETISESVHEVSSVQREKLHLAAVFVNNFTNHMYTIGKEICRKEDLSFNLLKPLIKETVDKLQFLTPKDAQTGPAIRNDVLTMQKHLGILENPIHKKIYQLISESIKETKQ